MSKAIEVREVDDFFDDPPHCPFCHAQVIAPKDDGFDYDFNPCPHLLFYAHDDGWEHLSEQARREFVRLGIMATDESLIDPDVSIDEITSRIQIPRAIKLATYMGPPGFHGAYLGFAPEVEERNG